MTGIDREQIEDLKAEIKRLQELSRAREEEYHATVFNGLWCVVNSYRVILTVSEVERGIYSAGNPVKEHEIARLCANALSKLGQTMTAGIVNGPEVHVVPDHARDCWEVDVDYGDETPRLKFWMDRVTGKPWTGERP